MIRKKKVRTMKEFFEKKVRNVDVATIALFFLTILNFAVGIFRCMRGECLFVDFRARWQESAYLFHGINPFEALQGKAFIEEIGVIDPDMVTVPWAWILGNIISPGFLPYEAAKIWGMTMFFVIAGLTSIVAYQYVEKNFFFQSREKKKWALLAVFIVLSQYCWVWSFMCGNHGAIACCFIVLAVCLYKEHPVLAGVCMAFAMIKPQVAALFFITFLILKQFKVIISAAACGLSAMLLIYGITGVGIFELLQQTTNVGTNLEGVFYGLFNMLKYQGISPNTILIMDIIAGMVYLVYVTSRDRKNEQNELEVFMGASIASTFWFYKQSHDYVILIIPCMILLHGIHELREKKFWIRLTEIVAFIFVFYVQSAVRKVSCLVFTEWTDAYSKELFMTFTCIFFIIMGIGISHSKE